MTALLTNGRARKSLADQIDRLDRTLDGLADNLGDVVAEAVQVAVQKALAEILSRPEMLASLRGARGGNATAGEKTPAAGPGLRERLLRTGRALGAQVRMASGALARRLRAMGDACQVGGRCMIDLIRRASRCGTAKLRTASGRFRNALVGGWQHLLLLRWLAGPVLTAAAVGGLVGVAAFYAGPWLAAVASGLGGFTTTAAVQAGLWFRRYFQDGSVLYGESFQD